ncbi:hypothetical protein ACFOOK_21535 [Micromonospora krabiensis]|uniref:Tetratricopeptide repeat-containing protein n=1 Tax=Micromonospora krabiensis TaxID=307121 RepID=A0A1C3N8D8_9ACTN|nr:hypothetical protein [Micromonospora krabiensis]SBV28847.1 hypothetical protein GA0070620_4404 [Micromonospora krabiensis]
MTTSEDDLWRLLREVNGMPYGAGQIAALEQLLRRVDAADDRHLAFTTRMQATTAYIYGGEPAKSFVTFSWCLSEFDRDPQPYHARHARQLLWHFKYMVNGMLTFPEVPLDRTYAVLDDMERRYRAGGQSLQAVHKHRFRVADHIGDTEAAAHWYRLWQTTPRDDLSDCAGCDPTTQVQYLTDTDAYADAVTLAEPVLAGRLSCNEQPQAILTALLLPYLRTGRHDEARSAHREAYRRQRGNLSDLWDIGQHVEFCTLTGNEARALELVERHLDWLDRAPSPAAAMHFAAAAAAALRQVDGDLAVYRRAAGDRPAADVPAAQLADELADTATALAARFDARNGTAHQSALVAARLTTRPTGAHLPLSASLRRRPATVAAGPAGAGGAAPADDAVAVPPAPVEVPADASPDDLLDLAEDHWRRHDRDTFRAALAAYDERFAGSELPPATVAHRTELRSAELTDAGDNPAAVETARTALSAYRELGDDVRAHMVAGRLGVLLSMTEEGAEEGLALATAAAEALETIGDAQRRTAGHDRVVLALVHGRRWAEALAALDRVPADAGGDPYLALRVALHRTHLLEELEREDEFRAAAAHSRELARELGVGELLMTASLAYARATDDPEEAVDACDEALRVAPTAALLPVRVARGRALMGAGRAGEAVDDFAEAVTLCVEQGAEGDAFLRWELANAYRVAGRLGEAAEVAEEAVLGLDRLGAQAEADRCRHLLAGVYQSLGEIDPALVLLDQLAANFDGPDTLPHRGQVLEEAGGILYDADRDALAAQRFGAAARAYELAGLRLDELRVRRREVHAWLWSGDGAAAARTLEVLDRLAATVAGGADLSPPETYELALAAEAGARVLAADDREDAALDRLAGVPERLRSIEAFGEAAQSEVFGGELLLRLGRPDEAERVLRDVLRGLPAGRGPAQQAAWLLARALDELGRPDEANALRAEHGLDHEH